MRFTALAPLLAPLAARAQSWQADADGFGQNAMVLMVAIGAGLAFFYVRAAYRRDIRSGHAAVAVCVGLAIVVAVFPAARAALALLAAGFLVYGFLRRT
jgi:asparagine N-glycosylation enzyme membrane subunit Stt3